MAITQTHRSYFPAGPGHLVIDTDTVCAITATGNSITERGIQGNVRLDGRLSPVDARTMGTVLVAWANGGPLLRGEAEFITDNGNAIRIFAEESDITLAVCSDGAEDVYIEYVLAYEDVVDLGQRLIVWAGVAV